MFRIIKTSVLVLLVLGSQLPATAQYTFDVKTKLSEKHRMQVAKQGVLHAIENSSWASVSEVGEDYSLWIKKLRREHRGDSIRVVLDVELRTRAMLTSGRLLSRQVVGLGYHWEQAQQYARDSIRVGFETESTDEELEEAAGGVGRLLSFASLLGGGPVVSQFSGAFVGGLVKRLSKVLKKDPSPLEVMESLALGDRVLNSAQVMIRNTRQGKE